MSLTMNNSIVFQDIPYLISVGNRVDAIVLPFIYLIGLVGNAFSLLTFSAPPMRELSCGVLLLLLSISDSFTLSASFFTLLKSVFDIDLATYSLVLCRFFYLMQFLFGLTSSWCLLLLTLNRFVRAQWPMKSKLICTPRNALISIGVIFLLLCGLYAQWFSPATGEADQNGTFIHCGAHNKGYCAYYYYAIEIRVFTDLIVYCFLPGLIMIVCNVKIVHEVSRIRQAVSGQKSTLEYQMRLMMLNSVSVFLVSTLPFAIYEILLGRVIRKFENFRRDNHNYLFIHQIIGLINYTHFATHFYLYCLTSRIFRSQFLRRITCGRRGKG